MADKKPTQAELSKRQGIHAGIDGNNIQETKNKPNLTEIRGTQKPIEKTGINPQKPVESQLAKYMNSDAVFDKTGLTKEYLDKKQALPLNLWVQDQNRAFRIEKRAIDAKQTKATMFQKHTRVSDEKENKAPGVSDIAIIDKDWVMSRFMTPSKDLEKIDRANRFFSSAGWKYTSTRLGYSMAINARPQFTRYADIKAGTKTAVSGSNIFQEVTVGASAPGKDKLGIGMGRYYSEAIDDNATTIFLEFGVPKFNSLLNFFGRAVNPVDSFIANKGYVPIGYYLGSIVGGFVMFCAFPLMSILIFIGKTVFKFFWGGAFNYYYLNPTMHTYWGSVNMLVTQLATELGLLSPFLLPSKAEQKKMGVPVQIDKEDVAGLADYFPNIFNRNTGYIDIYAVATRMQHLANKQAKVEYDTWTGGGQQDGTGDSHKTDSTSIMGYVQATAENDKLLRQPGKGMFATIDQYLTFAHYLYDMGNNKAKDPNTGNLATTNNQNSKLFDRANSGEGLKLADFPPENKTADLSSNESKEAYLASTASSSGERTFNTDDGSFNTTSEEMGWWEKMAEGLDSANRDGGTWAIFNVDYQGQVSESISNSVSDINTGGLLKSIANAARNVKFDTAGGNLVPGMEAVLDQVKGVVTGALESATFGLSNVIMTLLGGGYVDIPKKWDDSDVSFPSITYTMSLMSPYAHPIAQLQNIYIPLCMILAGSLPLKTGKASYTSPFICSLFNKGVQEIKLGMITSVSINRGTSNLGFNRLKKALAYEVSFTVTDFSNMMTAPINSSIFDELFNVSLEDDSKFATYMGVLASRDIYTIKYTKPKLKLKASRWLMHVSQATSAYQWSMRVSDVIRPVVSPFMAERRLNLTQNNNNNYF